ncbi:MAG: hypothetical protein IKH73_00615, partial [Erysipelotrichaceae bacterium]|nr:hypothetical protein [Erysipelotrichaceae bacterium]
MKKRLVLILCLMMILPSLAENIKAYSNYYNLYEGTPLTVSIDNKGDRARCEFVPSRTARYVFYSTSFDDTRANMYDSLEKEIASSDDSGMYTTLYGYRDFYIEIDLTAGKTYYLDVYWYDQDQTGSFNVVADRLFAYPVKSDFDVDPGDDLSMEVAGACRDFSASTYTWYWLEDLFESDGRSQGKVKLSISGPVFPVHECDHSGKYTCVVNEGTANETEVNFTIKVNNNFSVFPTMYSEHGGYILVPAGQDIVNVELDVYGNDQTDIEYYWYGVNTDGSYFLSSSGSSPSNFFSLTATHGVVIYAVDRYSNVASTSCRLVPVTETMHVGGTYNYSEENENHCVGYVFVPPVSGVYRFTSEGRSDPRIDILTGSLTDYSYVTGMDDNDGRNFILETELEGGKTYYISVYLYSFTETCTVKVEGPGSLSAENNGKKITVTVVPVEGATKYQLQRREKGTAQWTTLTSNLTAATYDDSTGLKMGKVYEYR